MWAKVLIFRERFRELIADQVLMIRDGRLIWQGRAAIRREAELENALTDVLNAEYSYGNYTQAEKDFWGQKDKSVHTPSYTVAVFFRLQYATGMRPQETRLLTRLDFDFVHDTVYIADSKRHKDRLIAVEHQLMETCRKYDEIARRIYPDTDIFFPNRNRKAHSAYMGHKTFRETCYYIHLMPKRISRMGCTDISGIIAEAAYED